MQKRSKSALVKEAISVISKRKIIIMAAGAGNRKAVRCLNRLADHYRQMAELDELYRGGDIHRDYFEKETELHYQQIRRIISGFDTEEILAKEYVKKKVTGSCTIDYNPNEDQDIILIKKVCGVS